ncbi:MAG: hypothetical protein WCP77_00930 [Roseococcus sp.]
MDESPIRSPHDEPLVADGTRPTKGGSYVRLPDGSLMPEDDWLAAQAEPSQPPQATQAAPLPAAEPPQATQAAPLPGRRRATEKEA